MAANKDVMKLLDDISEDTDGEHQGEQFVAMGGDGFPLFGHIVAYTLGEARIPHDKARGIWDARGIPIKPASHIDALKKAIARYGNVEHSRALADGTTLTGVFRIRDKGMNKNKETKTDEYIWELSYHETKTAREAQNHESLLQIVVYKKGKDITTSDISVNYLDHSASEQIEEKADQIIQLIKHEFESLINNISNDQIRDTLIKAIKDKDGVPFVVGRGGAWFIPLSSRDFTMKAKLAIKDTRAYATGKLDVRIIPVVKDDDLKASIAEDVASHVKQEFETLLRDTLRKLEKTTNDDNAQAILQDAISEKATLMGLKDRYEALLATTIELKLDEQPQMQSQPSERVQALLNELRGAD